LQPRFFWLYSASHVQKAAGAAIKPDRISHGEQHAQDVLAFAAVSFSWLGNFDATAAPAWQGAWGRPPTTTNDQPPVVRPDGGLSRHIYAPLPPYKDARAKAAAIYIPTTRFIG